MSTFTKEKLSASTDGMGVNVTATATAGTTIHTASATAATLDEVWLYAVNISALAVKLTIEYGGATGTDNIEVVVPPEAGLLLVLPGLLIANSKVIKAFAGTTAVITLHGYVNRIAA